MKRSQINHSLVPTAEQPAGFTLIEMLVAVTLVLLMMVMFGEMFQLASASVTKQRVMADNDQNARTFVTVLRADLDKRSFRTFVPFYANEPLDLGTPFGTRRGYIYLSNNNLNDGTDDVLQLTVDASVKTQNGDTTPFYGRAVALPGNFLINSNQPDRDDLQITPNEAGASRAAEIAYWMREGKLHRRVMLLRDPIPSVGTDATNPGDALLVTEDLNGNNLLNPGEDLNANGALDANTNYFIPANNFYPAASNFWNDFDYSSHRNPFVTPAFVVFNGIDYLLNSSPPLTGAPGFWTPTLGQSWNRFGHTHTVLPGSTLNGLPREFSASSTPNFFIGRFTHQETSDPNFQYPHRPAVGIGSAGNPMDGDTTVPAVNAPLLDTTPRDGVIDQFNDGNRTGVDLLLSNVQEFRIEVWDERLNDFVPVGHSQPPVSGVAGDYHISRQLNSTYGPLSGGVPHVLDTWHPRFNRNSNSNGSVPILGDVPDRPPFRPVTFDPLGVSGGPPPGVFGPPLPAPGYLNLSGNSMWWTPNVTYQPGDVVFPQREDLNGNGFLDPGEDGANGFPADGFLQENVRIGTEDVNYNGVLDVGEDLDSDMMLDLGAPAGMLTEDLNGDGDALDPGEDGSWGFPMMNPGIDTYSIREPLNPTGMTFCYRCIRTGISASNPMIPGANSILQEPFTSAKARSPGTIIRGWTEDTNNNGVPDPGEDLNGNGTVVAPTDREPDWLVEYNVRPLRAIRITVRFEHPTSKQMKQVTIVHSLRDTTSVP